MLEKLLPRTHRKLCAAALLLALAIIAAPDVFAGALSVFAGGCVFALILTPLSSLYERVLSRGLAAALSAVTLAGALLGVVLLILPLILEGLSDVERVISPMLRGSAVDWLPVPSGGEDIAEFAAGAVKAVTGFAGGAYRAFLSLVLGCFITASREAFLLRAELFLPAFVRKKGIFAAGLIRRELMLYARGQGMVALGVGSLAAAGLFLLGIPDAPALGIVVGICNMIPYFGPVIGGIPAVLAALSLGWERAALAAGLLVLVQQVDGFLISPRVLGSVAGVSPGVVMLSVFAGGQLAGPVGMLAAVPAVMVLRTLYRVFVQPPEND